MSDFLSIKQNDVCLDFIAKKESPLKLVNVSVDALNKQQPLRDSYVEHARVVEVQVTGEDRCGFRQAARYDVTSPGQRLSFVEYKKTTNEVGVLYDFVQQDAKTGLEVVSHFQFLNACDNCFRSWTTLTNKGNESLGIEYVSSFAYLFNFDGETLDDDIDLYVCNNGWQKELHWNTYTLPDVGLSLSQSPNDRISSKYFALSNTGNWSTKSYVPFSILYNKHKDLSFFYQIEHNGSWHAEYGELAGALYLKLSGPGEHNNHWWKNLECGQSFESVKVGVGICKGDFENACQLSTIYRRAIRRDNDDNKNLPVIFNDYMNGLWGDPTTEKELPLIDAAASVGAEYYVIDCGWYAKGDWWDSVGEWQEDPTRFAASGGLSKLCNYIKEKGMIPGLWIEIEVMGINCKLAGTLPDECYFMRHGKKITDRSRYQLDFRHPAVRQYATYVIERLIKDYGCGYFKIDYNIEPGIGTEINADSAGDGLLEHERAYLGWLDSIFKAHPDLVIENCSSGGLRMDYALLSRCSVQSTTDTTIPQVNSVVAVNAASAVTPEQAAVWAYPVKTSSAQMTAYNMVGALLSRIHLSGELASLDDANFELVKSAIALYKTYREKIATALPIWPLGYAQYTDDVLVYGLDLGDGTCLLSVFNRVEDDHHLVLGLGFKAESAELLYPLDQKCNYGIEFGSFVADIEASVCAKLFKITKG